MVATIGDLGTQAGVDYARYGMVTNVTPDLAEGAPYNITFLLDVDTFTITDFNHSHAAYEDACEVAGMEILGWRPCTVIEEGILRFGSEFWSTWRSHPCLWRLEARKRE